MLKGIIEYNKDAVTESANICMRWIYIRFAVLAILGSTLISTVTSYFASGARAEIRIILYGIAVLGCAATIAVCIIRAINGRKKYIKRYMDQIKTFYHAESAERGLEIDGESINIYGDGELKKELFLKDVMRVFQTSNYILIVFKGQVTLTVRKDSVEGGTVEDMVACLKHKNVVTAQGETSNQEVTPSQEEISGQEEAIDQQE